MELKDFLSPKKKVEALKKVPGLLQGEVFLFFLA